MTGAVTDPLASAEGTPLGPDRHGDLQRRSAAAAASSTSTARSGWSTSRGGGAVRIETAKRRRPDRRADRDVSGGDGVTYYWPSGRMRIDGNIATAGRRPADGADRASASRAAARR